MPCWTTLLWPAILLISLPSIFWNYLLSERSLNLASQTSLSSASSSSSPVVLGNHGFLFDRRAVQLPPQWRLSQSVDQSHCLLHWCCVGGGAATTFDEEAFEAGRTQWIIWHLFPSPIKCFIHSAEEWEPESNMHISGAIENNAVNIVCCKSVQILLWWHAQVEDCDTFCSRLLFMVAPKLWNSLPQHRHTANSQPIFRRLKPHIFDMAYPP